MAELTPSEKLQPALLDRLADNEPEKTVESREQRVMSMRKLRESVVRDLSWLLNTHNFRSVVASLGDFPEVERSVLNFGLPDLSGRVLTRDDVPALERAVHDAIVAFEPRLLRHSVKVQAAVDDRQMNQNSLRFHIEAELWAQPLPEHLFIRTELDLETGSVTVSGVHD